MKIKTHKTNHAANICLLVMACFPFLLFAQSTIDPQLIEGYAISRDVAYGEDAEQQMDIYIAPGANDLNKAFTIVFLHGGGYYISDKTKEERYIKPYLERGFHVVNMNYRLKRGIAVSSEDLTLALNYLKAYQSTYEVDLSRIIVTGFSAGAHIATLVGVTQNNPEYPHRLDKGIKIIGVINFSGPVDRLDVVERIFTEHEMELAQLLGKALFPETEDYATEEMTSALEPITYLDKKDPAIFIWHGGKDDQVPPQTFEQFNTQLKSFSGKHVIVYEDEAGHSPSSESLDAAYKKIFEFLNTL